MALETLVDFYKLHEVFTRLSALIETFLLQFIY